MSGHSAAAADFLIGYTLLGALYSIIAFFLSVGPAITLFGVGGWGRIRRATPISLRLLIGVLWLTMICAFVVGVSMHEVLRFAPIPGATATIFFAYLFKREQRSRGTHHSGEEDSA